MIKSKVVNITTIIDKIRREISHNLPLLLMLFVWVRKALPGSTGLNAKVLPTNTRDRYPALAFMFQKCSRQLVMVNNEGFPFFCFPFDKTILVVLTPLDDDSQRERHRAGWRTNANDGWAMWYRYELCRTGIITALSFYQAPCALLFIALSIRLSLSKFSR
jgi:hypothetical protein